MFKSLNSWSATQEDQILRRTFIVTDLKHHDDALETEEEICRLVDRYGCRVFFFRRETAEHIARRVDEERRSQLYWFPSGEANVTEILRSATALTVEFHAETSEALSPEVGAEGSQTFEAFPSLLAAYIVRFVLAKHVISRLSSCRLSG